MVVLVEEAHIDAIAKKFFHITGTDGTVIKLKNKDSLLDPLPSVIFLTPEAAVDVFSSFPLLEVC